MTFGAMVFVDRLTEGLAGRALNDARQGSDTWPQVDELRHDPWDFTPEKYRQYQSC
jgi:hypothetical protein